MFLHAKIRSIEDLVVCLRKSKEQHIHSFTKRLNSVWFWATFFKYWLISTISYVCVIFMSSICLTSAQLTVWKCSELEISSNTLTKTTDISTQYSDRICQNCSSAKMTNINIKVPHQELECFSVDFVCLGHLEGGKPTNRQKFHSKKFVVCAFFRRLPIFLSVSVRTILEIQVTKLFAFYTQSFPPFIHFGSFKIVCNNCYQIY